MHVYTHSQSISNMFSACRHMRNLMAVIYENICSLFGLGAFVDLHLLCHVIPELLDVIVHGRSRKQIHSQNQKNEIMRVDFVMVDTCYLEMRNYKHCAHESIRLYTSNAMEEHTM